MSDREFVDYLVRSNNALGERQVIGLAKIAAFCKDQNLHELRQGEIKDQCLHEWQIPNEARFVIPLFGNLQIIYLFPPRFSERPPGSSAPTPRWNPSCHRAATPTASQSRSLPTSSCPPPPR